MASLFNPITVTELFDYFGNIDIGLSNDFLGHNAFGLMSKKVGPI